MKKKLLAFILPISILCLAFILLGIFPFGDRSIIVIDSDTQYVEFISNLRTLFTSNNDFKYTFSATLGQNTIPFFGYYLISPLNLISLLFKPENIKLAMTLIILIKIGLCGLTCNHYLTKRYKGSYETLIFSTAFALMSYSVVYMYHIMWFDSIMLLPLMILGIDYIFEGKKPILYIVSLTLAIILNYYIGWMMCLGSAIYFIYKYILDAKKINKFKTIIDYSVSSVLSGLISMVIIIPTLLGLQSGKASFSLSNLKFETLTSYLRIMAKSLTASFGPGETWNGGPMIACGMIITILLFLYFMNKEIKPKKRIMSFILIFTMFTTFVVQAFDLIFHSFNAPNCFDYRHAFICVFFMIIIAYESYRNLKPKESQITLTSYIFIALSIAIFIAKYNFLQKTYFAAIGISLILVFIILSIIKNSKQRTKSLFIVQMFDLLINTVAALLIIIIPQPQSNSTFKEFVVYGNKIVNSVKEYDTSLYRMEKTFERFDKNKMYSANDSMLFDYNGITHFDSTTRSDVEAFLEKLGFKRLVSRTYYNKEGSTKFADLILGIKYVLSDKQYKNYVPLFKTEDMTVYENPYYLSLGYVINKETYNLEIEENNYDVFQIQNDIATSITGLNKDIYTRENDYKQYVNNAIIEGNTLKVNTLETNETASITYKVKIHSNNELLFYFSNDGDYRTTQPSKVYVNGEYRAQYFDTYAWGVLSLGNFKPGETVEIKFEFQNLFKLYEGYFYYENLNVLKEHYNILSKTQVDLIKETSSKLKGTVNTENDTTIMLTIPYDESWEIKVDGNKVEQKKVLNVLTAIDIEKGEHTIEMKYEPKGLKLGVLISSISLIITTIYLLLWKFIWKIYYKYESIFNYIIVGGMTTVVSLVSYYMFSRVFDININIYFILANTLSWVCAVVFAYITNKIFVFKSKTEKKETVVEIGKFVLSRVATYVIDLALMFILVKAMSLNNDFSKLLVQFIVLVLNYIFSKLLVFKK